MNLVVLSVLVSDINLINNLGFSVLPKVTLGLQLAGIKN